MRFYLDEDLSHKIAELAWRKGVDITTTRDERMMSATDREQLRFAATVGRCIVTRNRDDFSELTQEFLMAGEAHAGVLCVSPSFPNNDFVGIAQALARFASRNPDDMPAYMVDWLVPAQRQA